MSSEIFSGANMITKQNFHRVTILRLRVKSLSRLILVNKRQVVAPGRVKLISRK